MDWLNHLRIGKAPIMTGAFALFPYDTRIERRLTLVDKFDEPYKLCQVINAGTDNPLIKVPRCLAPLGVDKRAIGEPIKVSLVPEFKFREGQVGIYEEMKPLLEAEESFFLELGTGIGKTVMSMPIITWHQRKTLIMVDQDNLKHQWRTALKKCLGLTDDQIGTLQGDVCDVVGKPVVIAMVQSIYKEGRYPPWVYSLFGLVIADEVHVMAAEQFNKAMWMFPAKIRVGLSATVARKDGREIAFISHIGTKRVQSENAPMIPKVIIVESEWQCPRVKKKDPKGNVMYKDGKPVMVRLPHSGGKTMHLNKMLASDPKRNAMIADFMLQSYKVGRNVLVMSDLKDGHLPELKRLAVELGIPPKDIGFYVGGMKQEELDKSSRKNIVLSTYKMTAKAVDCPWWDTLIIATPRSDTRQAMGRILREYAGKVCARAETPSKGRVPVVFDIVDVDSPVFEGYFFSRVKEYRKRGCPLKGNMNLISNALRRLK